ncbi:DUF1707 domain-containing protein [Nocardia sp. NPDC046473]|uniref:DUF1707 domain-containing protein n=1 Tax=Nocardia sp. NPDC046473 TaxID=3155733 RepID=UPI0033E389A1
MTDAQDKPGALPAVRVADTDREVAVRRLHIAVTEGRLDVLELDRRLVLAYAAQTSAELVAVTADLPTATEPIELRTKSGSRDKRGQWVVPAELTAECGSGSITFDFTQALCAHTEIALHATAGSGSIKLIVPRGWRVDVDRVRTKSGSVSNRATEPLLPGAPVLRVDGKVGSGSLSVRYPRPPRRSFLAWLLRRPRPA